jgi:hypothetical protein
MLAATSKFLRQIVPPVIATLIAALLIAGFNRAFSTHLTQPRLGVLNSRTNAEVPDERVMPRPAAVRPAWTAEIVDEPVPVREWQKGGVREAAKDPIGIRAAETTPAAPPAPAVTRRSETRQIETRHVETRQVESRPAESRQIETRRVESHGLAPVMAVPPVGATPPVVVVAPAPPPVVLATPVAPPVVVAAPVRQDMVAEPPMVTVPDRQRPQPQPQFDERPAQPPQQGTIGTIASTLNPSTWFARAREFGEKIEAVGNDILPNIRQ